jgi:uncharacterized protein YdhG (YjbR/CyaY superfamily)
LRQPAVLSLVRHLLEVNTGMRQTSSQKGGSGAKGQAAPKDVDEYLARVPEPARGTLNKVRAVIRSVLPAEATEALSYGMPAFKYKGSLVGYAAFANHCSFFPMNSSLVDAFRDELKGYATSKGTIRFPVDKPLPAALVKKMVKARVLQNEQKKRR